jgi:hypothetical protein
MSGIPIQAPTNPPPGTAAILSTLAVSLAVGVVGFVAFAIGRRWIRRFYVRSPLNAFYHPLQYSFGLSQAPRDTFGYSSPNPYFSDVYSWLFKTVRYSEKEMLISHGIGKRRNLSSCVWTHFCFRFRYVFAFPSRSRSRVCYLRSSESRNFGILS